MNRNFIYFINPISGNKNKLSLLEIIKKRTVEVNIPFQILYTNKEGNYDYLIQKIIVEKITDIIICGGDGTVNAIVSSILNIEINIGIIPMGSGNSLAFAAKISKNINKALDNIFNGHAIYIDSFLINNKLSCMLCGLGYDAQVAHEFAKQKRRGLKTYVKESIKNLIPARTFSFSVVINNLTLNVDAFFISIANSNQFGNNFTIAPKASLHDGLLDIVIVNKMNKIRLLWAIFKQIKFGKVLEIEDKKYHNNKIHYFQTNKIIIHNLNLAPFHIDGEPQKTNELFNVEIIKNAFKLLMPNNLQR